MVILYLVCIGDAAQICVLLYNILVYNVLIMKTYNSYDNSGFLYCLSDWKNTAWRGKLRKSLEMTHVPPQYDLQSINVVQGSRNIL